MSMNMKVTEIMRYCIYIPRIPMLIDLTSDLTEVSETSGIEARYCLCRAAVRCADPRLPCGVAAVKRYDTHGRSSLTLSININSTVYIEWFRASSVTLLSFATAQHTRHIDI